MGGSVAKLEAGEIPINILGRRVTHKVTDEERSVLIGLFPKYSIEFAKLPEAPNKFKELIRLLELILKDIRVALKPVAPASIKRDENNLLEYITGLIIHNIGRYMILMFVLAIDIIGSLNLFEVLLKVARMILESSGAINIYYPIGINKISSGRDVQNLFKMEKVNLKDAIEKKITEIEKEGLLGQSPDVWSAILLALISASKTGAKVDTLTLITGEGPTATHAVQPIKGAGKHVEVVNQLLDEVMFGGFEPATTTVVATGSNIAKDIMLSLVSVTIIGLVSACSAIIDSVGKRMKNALEGEKLTCVLSTYDYYSKNGIKQDNTEGNCISKYGVDGKLISIHAIVMYTAIGPNADDATITAFIESWKTGTNVAIDSTTKVAKVATAKTGEIVTAKAHSSIKEKPTGIAEIAREVGEEIESPKASAS